MFVFKEQVHPEGGKPRTVAFTDVDIKPRSYDELLVAKLHQGICMDLEMYNGRIVEIDAEEVDTDQYAHITAKLVSSFTARAIGLVRGGWLPSYLAATRKNAVILPDRNIITEIHGRFKNGRKAGREPDFLDLFEGLPVRINPMLAVMEGNGRAIPESAATSAQFKEIADKLKEALPSAVIMVGPASIMGMHALIEGTRSEFERKQEFLMRLGRTLASPVARSEIDARWVDVIAVADDCKVPRASLAVLAVLSALVNPSGYCAAKKLLKFHAKYDESDAYNALCDLRSLEILTSCFAFFPEMDTQLCTADRHLALFWVGANLSEIERDGDEIRYSMEPHRALLPAGYVERWADAVGFA